MAALAVALLGVAAAALDAVLSPGGMSLSLGEVIRLGGVYLGAFHRVPMEIGVPLGGDASTIGVTAAPLAGTLLAGWLLYRAGRATAEASGLTSPLRRGLRSLRVVPAYVVPVAVIGVSLSVAPVHLG